MVSRSDTSKTIRRRTGGAGKKTGKGTSLKKINIDKYRWEDDPDFKGTPGPYNPRSKKMRKKKYDYDTYMDLGPLGPIGVLSKDADWPVAKRKLIREGKIKGPLSKREQRILADQDKRGGQYKPLTKEMQDKFDEENRRKYQAAAEMAAPLADQRKTGGTVKKVIGGKIVKKVLSRSKDKGKKGDPGVTYGGGTKKSAVIGQKRVADYTRKRRIEGGVAGTAGGAGLGFVAGTKKKKSKSKKSKTPMHRPVAMAKKGGQLKRKTYGGHHGSKLVAKLYD